MSDVVPAVGVTIWAVLGATYAEAFSACPEGLPWVYARDPESKWLHSGTFSFYGFSETSIAAYEEMWGGSLGHGPPTDVAQRSYADMEANRNGMKFWQQLYAGDFLDDAWNVLNYESRPRKAKEFDICDYVNKEWLA